MYFLLFIRNHKLSFHAYLIDPVHLITLIRLVFARFFLPTFQILRESPSESQPATNTEKKDNAFLEWLELLTGIQRPLPPLKPAENCTECSKTCDISPFLLNTSL